MKHAALLILLASASAASAEPAPSTILLTEAEFQTLNSGLTATTTEPVGFQVGKSPNAALAKLGLQANDIVKRINGDVPSYWGTRAGRIHFIEFTRGASQLVVKVGIKPTGPLVENVEVANLEAETKPLTKNGKPSGLLVDGPVTLPFETGDVIRSIDGKAVVTSKELRAALDAAIKANKTAKIAIERNDIAIEVEATAYLDEVQQQIASGIKKVDETHFEIKKAFIDAVVKNPMAVSKGARVVPSMKDGKANGIKLYAIRPSSVFAALGLSNGDTLVSVNQLPMTSADAGLEIYKKLSTAKKLDVEIVRRGKPLTLTYTIR